MPIGDFMGSDEEVEYANRPARINGNTAAGLGILRPNKRRKPKKDQAAATLAQRAEERGQLGYPSTATYSNALKSANS